MARTDNDARLTIRVPQELKDWLAVEGKPEGLDVATCARVKLMRLMNGLPRSGPSYDREIIPSIYEAVEAAERGAPEDVVEAIAQEATAGIPVVPVAGDRVTWEQLNEGAKQMMQAPNGDGGVQAKFRPPLPFSQVPPGWR